LVLVELVEQQKHQMAMASMVTLVAHLLLVVM